MTVLGWVFFWAITITIVAIAIVICAANYEEKNGAIIVAITILVAVFVIFGLNRGMSWWFSNTESGKRAIKTQESNFEGGINRSVKVYDAVGNVLQEYSGRFDVDFDGDEQRILFDDENGKRHVIYFKTGTVIVEEI